MRGCCTATVASSLPISKAPTARTSTAARSRRPRSFAKATRSTWATSSCGSKRCRSRNKPGYWRFKKTRSRPCHRIQGSMIPRPVSRFLRRLARTNRAKNSASQVKLNRTTMQSFQGRRVFRARPRRNKRTPRCSAPPRSRPCQSRRQRLLCTSGLLPRQTPAFRRIRDI